VWVENGRLLYGEKQGKPERTVLLQSIQSVYALPPDVMKGEGAPRQLWSFGFKLTADDRSILWAAPDFITRRAFIEFLSPMAKRQPSGLHPRASVNYYGSVNNDESVVNDDVDPFEDDYDDNDNAEESTNEVSASSKTESNLGGPKSGQTGKTKKSSTKSFVHDPVVPLSSTSMFASQIEQLCCPRRDEGLSGVAVVNTDGLCLRAAGELDAYGASRVVKVAAAARRLAQKNSSTADGSGVRMVSLVVECEAQGSSGRTVSMGSADGVNELWFIAIQSTRPL